MATARALLSRLRAARSPAPRAFPNRTFPIPSSPIPQLRPLASDRRGATRRWVSSRSTTASSIQDPSPASSKRPPNYTIDGCDYEHWFVGVEKPDEKLTREEIIDSYIKILARVIGSEEEARMKIYSVSTKYYFAFGALVDEELACKIKDLPGVHCVIPDFYLNEREKDYGGEPFIDGKAVPYNPKFHEAWELRKFHDRPLKFDRPRNFELRKIYDRPLKFDRPRNFEQRRENMQSYGHGDQADHPCR